MGSRTEKLLIEAIKEVDDYEGLRVDFGGGAGFHMPHDAGDIIIGKAQDALHPPSAMEAGQISTFSDLFIIEEKYKSTKANKYLQEDGEKLDAMIEFALAIGATPVFAGRWSTNTDWSPGPQHYVRDAREVERTNAGNVSLKPETAENEYSTVEDFFSTA